VSLADHAGDMLAKLVPDIKKTAELVREVATASREQSIGIDQTNKALQDLDRVTQQNAAAAEQMASTAGELSTHAGELQTAIAFFRVDGVPAAAAPHKEDRAGRDRQATGAAQARQPGEPRRAAGVTTASGRRRELRPRPGPRTS
jgi:methyl-accepting chemotaxis protein